MARRAGNGLASVARAAGIAGIAGVVASVLTFQARRARRSAAPLEGFERDVLDGPIGDGEPRLRVAWIGDSLSVGLGASAPDRALPRRVAAGLGRPVELTVVGVSGARAADALNVQLPALAGVRPDWVFVEIGANDVIHLSSRRAFRRTFDAVLRALARSEPERIVALGIGDFGATPLLPQPLRWAAGVRGRQIDRDIRSLAERHGALYVDVRGRAGHLFGQDPVRYHAADGFHPSEDGLALWAGATLGALRDAGAI